MTHNGNLPPRHNDDPALSSTFKSMQARTAAFNARLGDLIGRIDNAYKVGEEPHPDDIREFQAAQQEQRAAVPKLFEQAGNHIRQENSKRPVYMAARDYEAEVRKLANGGSVDTIVNNVQRIASWYGEQHNFGPNDYEDAYLLSGPSVITALQGLRYRLETSPDQLPDREVQLDAEQYLLSKAASGITEACRLGADEAAIATEFMLTIV